VRRALRAVWIGQGSEGSLHRRLDLDQPLFFVADALGHDAVFEVDGRLAPAELLHLKAGRGLFGDVEAFAVAVGREEDVVLDFGVDGLARP
jgi:hypothetical protein